MITQNVAKTSAHQLNKNFLDQVYLIDMFKINHIIKKHCKIQ
jgi:hypothetical protein